MSSPPLVCNNPQLMTPKILWYQNDVEVVARIMLPDVQDYYLKIQRDHFLFSTILNDKKYCACMRLFGTVIAEATTHMNIGREIKIRLAKAHRWTAWPRLHFERCKNSLIVADPEHVYDEIFTKSKTPIFEGGESFAQYKMRNFITNIMPDVPSTDEEESDDDIFNEIYE